MDYIDEHWRPGHVLARDPRMFAFQYRTPWVDRDDFPTGTSVMCAYRLDGTLVGFLGAIAAPYPSPRSCWLALWHVLPETKGLGVGGRLLDEMHAVATRAGGWIGGHGANQEALPIYQKRGYELREVRRWVHDPAAPLAPPASTILRPGELRPDEAWERYRFDDHPVFAYERHGSTVVRCESNSWGRVTHVLRLGSDWPDVVAEVDRRERRIGSRTGVRYLLDAWTVEPPGDRFVPADAELPSVFHPPEARGAVQHAIGYPYCPTVVEKGDGDLDRPT
jgi:GNAT superfamily N-acetyltransferase